MREMSAKSLLETLRSSVRDIVQTESRVAVAYSGGVDSSLVAALAAENAECTCYTAVVPGSHDARTIVESADIEGRTLKVISLTDAELRSLASKAAALVGHDSPVAVGYTIPLVAVIEKAAEGLVLAGNGADELFGGYAKYLSSVDPESEMRSDLEKAMGEASALRGYSTGQGKRIEFPFLSTAVRHLALETPLDQKVQGSTRKLILREAAKDLGLQSHLRPKKAAQYSSGCLRRLEKLAAADGIPLSAWIKKT